MLWHERRAVLLCNNLFFLFFQNQTLELAALSPSIESLNEASIKLPLSDFTLKKMQSLTRQWSQKTAAALECCRYEMKTKKKSLVTIPFAVINMKTKLKHGMSCNLFLRGLAGGILPFQFTWYFSGHFYSNSLEAKTWMFIGEEGSEVPSETPTMLILLTTTLEHL